MTVRARNAEEFIEWCTIAFPGPGRSQTDQPNNMINYQRLRGPDPELEGVFSLDWDDIETSRQWLYRQRYCRLRKVSMKILQLLRLRRLWSQISSLLNVTGRNSVFTNIQTFVRNHSWCRRRRSTNWTLGQARAFVGRQLRNKAILFAHLHSVKGFQQYKSKAIEEEFRRIIRTQIHAAQHLIHFRVMQRSLRSVRASDASEALSDGRSLRNRRARVVQTT